MNIARLIDLLHEERCSLVVGDTRGNTRTFWQKGVRDLEYLLDHEPATLRGAAVADKVVGKAAAGMMACAGVAEVYADVLSRKAVPLLDANNIKYSFARLVDQIIIADGDTRCPLEKIVGPATTAEETVSLLRRHFAERKRTKEMTIRKATTADAKRLLEIYAPYVEQTAITFEYEVPTVGDFASRIAEISATHPYLVAVDGDKTIGYAYARQFRSRAAYQWGVETSIYLDMAERHHGAGRLLYAELESELKKQGILNMNACITYLDHPDAQLPLGSVSFHKAMGFSLCAHFHKCGRKFGKWYDTIWMEKMIGIHK